MASNPAEILAAGQALVPNAGDQMLRQQMGRLQIQGAQLQMQAQAQQLKQAQTAFQRQQSFGHDMETFTSNPTPQGLASLFGRYPEFAKPIQDAHGALDEGRRKTDMTQIGSVAAMASRGDFKGAGDLMETRIAADRAAGQDTASDEAILEHFRSPDPAQQKIGVAMAAIGLGGAVGPEQAAAFLKANGLSDESYTLGPGSSRFNGQNEVVASVAEDPKFIVRPADSDLVPLNGSARAMQAGGGAAGAAATGGGGQASAGGGGVAPAAAAVASTLSSGGLPAPVVAGFMGNFHAEGGWAGAQGDGGSASGVAQLRGERRDNFTRMFGMDPQHASPEDQARFTLWEMQNPQAAGMTVKQRDAILAAKTPAQAAALIDQFYERSDGSARQGRMAAATAFAGASAAPSTSASGQNPVRPGDPPGTIYGRPKPGYHLLTPDQAQAQGLDTAKRWQVGPDGQTTAVGDASVAAPGDPGKTGPAYLATVPAGMASQVKALAEGRLPLPSSFALSKPYWQRLLQATAQYDPSFDAATAKARQQAVQQFTGNGKAAIMVGSVNRVANHLQTLYDASEKLVGPNTGWTVTDSIAARVGQSFQAQSLKAYNTALPLVADELEKIARNSNGTLHGVEQIMANLSPNEALATRRQAIKTAIELIHGAIEPLQNQYNSAFQGSSARPNIPWVTSRSQQIYDRLAGENFSLGEEPAPRGDATPHTGLPAGAKLIGKRADDGRPVYQLPNGQKVSPR